MNSGIEGKHMNDNLDKEKPTKYKRLVTDTIVFALGNLGSKVILFFMVPLYTNYMTTEEYGTSDLVFTVAQLLVPFVSVLLLRTGKGGIPED